MLLMQASQVYSATSHWQSQVDAADSAKQEAVNLLQTVQDNMQVTLVHFPSNVKHPLHIQNVRVISIGNCTSCS